MRDLMHLLFPRLSYLVSPISQNALYLACTRSETDNIESPEVEAPAKQPPNKKRKTAPVSADKVPADEDEVEDDEKNGVDVPDDDGIVIEDVEDSAEEDAIAESAPATKVKEAKRAAAPAENDLEEVDELAGAEVDEEE